jgi:hypothetical protein
MSEPQSRESATRRRTPLRAALMLGLGSAIVTGGAIVVFLNLHLSLLMQGLVGIASLVGFLAVLYAILEAVLAAIENAVGERVPGEADVNTLATIPTAGDAAGGGPPTAA